MTFHEMEEYIKRVTAKGIKLTINSHDVALICQGLSKDYDEDGRALLYLLMAGNDNFPKKKLDRLFNVAKNMKEKNLHAFVLLRYAEEAGYKDGKFTYDSFAEGNDEGEDETKNGKDSQSSKTRKASVQDVCDFLNENYNLRYNTIKGVLQVREIDKLVFEDMNDRTANTLLSKFRALGLCCTKEFFLSTINSELVENWNPVEMYFENLEAWDPSQPDYFKELIDRIELEDNSPDNREYLYNSALKWNVSNVRMWMSKEINQNILALTGPQGIGKSYFISHLLPPELRDYYNSQLYKGKYDRDDMLAMSQNLLICFEELDNMKNSDMNTLKAMTTLGYINERKVYGVNREKRRRMAGFCATGNNPRILNDPSGNRRWLVFKVKNIDNSRPINYSGLYSQLYEYALDEDFRSWFNNEEIEIINRHNREHEVINVEEELILKHYCKPAVGMSDTMVSTSDILLKINSGVKNQLSAAKIGMFMGKLGFEKQKTNKGIKYHVHEYKPAEITANSEAETAIFNQENGSSKGKETESDLFQGEQTEDAPF